MFVVLVKSLSGTLTTAETMVGTIMSVYDRDDIEY